MIDATRLFRVYANQRRRILAALNPRTAQERVLFDLLRTASDTRFGRGHRFARIGSIADFQEAVPLTRFDAMWETYWEPTYPLAVNQTWPGRVPYFVLTSGTTKTASKRIPLTREMIRSNVWAGLDVISHHLANRPESRALGGASMMLGASARLTRVAAGVKEGDLSGVAYQRIPWWFRQFAFPPPAIAEIASWDERLPRIAERAPMANLRILSGTTSWLMVLIDAVQAAHPHLEPTARSMFPNLEMLVHGGTSLGPYRKRFERFIEGSKAELREVYPASEGFFALGDAGTDDGLRLVLDNGIFFEFVPLEEIDSPTPTRRWIGNVETGVDYAIVVSTNSGLWGYIVGDTVRFVSLDPPRIVVSGRISYWLSAFGEHLSAEEIERGLIRAAQEIGTEIAEFSAGARYAEEFDDGDGRGANVFVVECTREVHDAEKRARFARVLDQDLIDGNDDYRPRRVGGLGMRDPIIVFAPPGSFAAWMARRGRAGGQNKVPRVINDQDLLADLCGFVAERANT